MVVLLLLGVILFVSVILFGFLSDRDVFIRCVNRLTRRRLRGELSYRGRLWFYIRHILTGDGRAWRKDCSLG